MAEELTLRQLSLRFGKMAIADKFIIRSVGKHLKNACKSYIGHERPEWPKLSPTTEIIKERMGAPLNAPLERTGESKKDIHYKVAPSYKYVDVYSDSEGLVDSEHGTPNQPPRPLFGLAIKKEQANIEKMTGAFMMAALSGKPDGFPTLIAGDEDVKRDFLFFVNIAKSFVRMI